MKKELLYVNRSWFLILYQLLRNPRIKGREYLTRDILEVELGYDKRQLGGIRMYIKYLINIGVLKRIDLTVIRPLRYVINKKLAEKLFEKSMFYCCAYDYHGAMTSEFRKKIPLPGHIFTNNIKKSEINKIDKIKCQL